MTENKGFTLIELLVALVVISVGIVGMLALQARGFQASQESLHRSQAILFAQALEQRMLSSSDKGQAIFNGRATENGIFDTLQDQLQGNIPNANAVLALIPDPPTGNQTYRLTVTWPRGTENSNEQMVVNFVL